MTYQYTYDRDPPWPGEATTLPSMSQFLHMDNTPENYQLPQIYEQPMPQPARSTQFTQSPRDTQSYLDPQLVQIDQMASTPQVPAVPVVPDVPPMPRYFPMPQTAQMETISEASDEDMFMPQYPQYPPAQPGQICLDPRLAQLNEEPEVPQDVGYSQVYESSMPVMAQDSQKYPDPNMAQHPQVVETQMQVDEMPALSEIPRDHHNRQDPQIPQTQAPSKQDKNISVNTAPSPPTTSPPRYSKNGRGHRCDQCKARGHRCIRAPSSEGKVRYDANVPCNSCELAGLKCTLTLPAPKQKLPPPEEEAPQLPLPPEPMPDFPALAQPMPPVDPDDMTVEEATMEEDLATLTNCYRRLKAAEKTLNARFKDATEALIQGNAANSAGPGALGGAPSGVRKAALARQKRVAVDLADLRTEIKALVNLAVTDPGEFAPEVLLTKMHYNRSHAVDEWARGLEEFPRTVLERCEGEDMAEGHAIVPERRAGGQGRLAYCPIVGDRQMYVVAARVVNLDVPDARVANALFGDSEVGYGHDMGYHHLWHPSNGLMVCQGYRELLDTGQAVLLPASIDPHETGLVFHLLTKNPKLSPPTPPPHPRSMCNPDLAGNKPKRPRPKTAPRASIWDPELLHRRPLTFMTDNPERRPATPYILFKAIMTFLRLIRHRSCMDDVLIRMEGETMPALLGSSIAPVFWDLECTGKYARLRHSILYAMVRMYALLSAEQADAFWGGRPSRDLSGETGEAARLSARDKLLGYTMAVDLVAAMLKAEMQVDDLPEDYI